MHEGDHGRDTPISQAHLAEGPFRGPPSQGAAMACEAVPQLYIMQSLDPGHLARAIGTDRCFWPLDYDLTTTQWEQREAAAAGMARTRFTSLHTLGGPGPSPVISYSRDLIRLAFLPPTLRAQVVEAVARIVKGDVDRGALPTPHGWRRKEQGRTPIYQWQPPKRAKGQPARDRAPTVQQRFQLIARLDAFGYTTAEIVQAVRENFGLQWPGQHETYANLPLKERTALLNKLHRDTVQRDVKKARHERTRKAERQ